MEIVLLSKYLVMCGNFNLDQSRSILLIFFSITFLQLEISAQLIMYTTVLLKPYWKHFHSLVILKAYKPLFFDATNIIYTTNV